jgi:hypothetical protein
VHAGCTEPESLEVVPLMLHQLGTALFLKPTLTLIVADLLKSSLLRQLVVRWARRRHPWAVMLLSSPLRHVVRIDRVCRCDHWAFERYPHPLSSILFIPNLPYLLPRLNFLRLRHYAVTRQPTPLTVIWLSPRWGHAYGDPTLIAASTVLLPSTRNPGPRHHF